MRFLGWFFDDLIFILLFQPTSCWLLPRCGIEWKWDGCSPIFESNSAAKTKEDDKRVDKRYQQLRGTHTFILTITYIYLGIRMVNLDFFDYHRNTATLLVGLTGFVAGWLFGHTIHQCGLYFIGPDGKQDQLPLKCFGFDPTKFKFVGDKTSGYILHYATFASICSITAMFAWENFDPNHPEGMSQMTSFDFAMTTVGSTLGLWNGFRFMMYVSLIFWPKKEARRKYNQLQQGDIITVQVRAIPPQYGMQKDGMPTVRYR